MESDPPRFTVSIGDLPGGDRPDAPVVVHKRGVDLRSAELLRHEREVLARVAHPGVVELAPDSDGAGPPTLSTYLAGNLTLADRPPRSAAAIAATGAQIATTLAELHDAGTAHGAIAPEHCVIGPGGSIVLCSLRRATTVSGTDHPAARRDVADLVEVLRTWRREAPSARRDRAGGRLDALLASAGRQAPAARDLAVALSGVDGPPTVRRDERPRSSPPLPPPEEDRRGSAWAPIGALAASVAVGVALWSVDVPDPSVTAGGLPPALATTVEALRYLALAACGYLATLAALTAAASLTSDERIARAAERLGPSRVRRWAAGLTSLGVVGSAAAANLPSGTAPSSRRIEVPRPTPSTPPSTALSTSSSTTTTIRPAPTTSMPASAPPPLLATPVGPAVPSTWTVARGDHLWSIAERTLAQRLARAATDDEVRRYWRTLIETNRDRLADPSNPDLIFVGQVFLLPPA